MRQTENAHNIPQKVLFFCNEDQATSWQRIEAFKNLDVILTVKYHTPRITNFHLLIKIIRSIFHRIGFPLEYSNENKILLKTLENTNFDIIFIEKCLTLRPSTLKKIKIKYAKIKLVNYTLDDYKGKGNKSVFYNLSIPLYDLIATNKKHNVTEYYESGAQKVHYFHNAFSIKVHKPFKEMSSEEKSYYGADICFVGTYEKRRSDLLNYIANKGLKIKVWGWNASSIKSKINHPNIINMDKHVYFDELAKVFSASKICLNFLRKSNRDTETTRSMEIPACGAFMIAERTEEHSNLFIEDKEAVYFNTNLELIQKINYYLSHEDERLTIAKTGWQRCIDSHYHYENQLMNILKQVNEC